MNNKSKLVLAGILGMSLTSQAGQLGITLVTKEALDKISEERHFSNMTEMLLASQIIQETNTNGYYILNMKRLKDEKGLAKTDQEQEIIDILNTIFESRIKVSLKKFKEMQASTQDHSPMVKGDQIQQNQKFRRDQ